ncbi:MAG TPA: S1-like domain-containing RNA-binding protein [Polyangiaceae bacterium]
MTEESIARLLGRTARGRIERVGPPGVFLAIDSTTILLPNAEVPEGAKVGDELDVFVHLDSDDRPITTRRTPAIRLGEVAFLEVVDVAPFGAFVDWGLVKQLLVPLAEQTRDIHRGERHAIGLFLDRSGRLAGTMRVTEMLRKNPPFAVGDWVSGEAWRDDPSIGVFVIVERAYVGLVPRAEPHRLARGEAARFRVTNVLGDGKIELSLRGLAHEERDADAEKILAALRAARPPKIGDASSPETIRATFGLSKKAFKRAAGALLKRGLVAIDGEGFFVARL